MAERVQRHLELMVDEIEEMQRVRLYTRDETKKILKRRKEFEYKINGLAKNIKDYQDYIQFELLLVKQIRTRRKLGKINDRKHSIEYKILRRVKKLYEIAVDRFSTDFPLHLAFFKFCKQYNFTIPCSILTEHMIQRFPNLPEVYQIAASWFAIERNDLKRGLSIIHKGLSLHKNDKLLYKEAIKLELYPLDKQDGDDDKEQIEKLQKIIVKKLQAYTNVILQTMDDCGFFIEILNLLQEYPFTVELQQEIIEKLLNNYADKAVVWNALALREKTNDPISIQWCCKKFEQGLLQVSDKQKHELWQNYLDFLNQYRNLGDCEKLLKQNLERASDINMLSERFYILWLELVTDDKAQTILQKATESLSKSQNLWSLRLKLAILRNDDNLVQQVFEEGVKNLCDKSLQLWLMYLDYNKSNSTIVESLFENAVKQNEISSILKPKYIEWLIVNKNIDEARRVYTAIANERPFSKDLHFVMAKFEEQQEKFDLHNLDLIHQLACRQFGEECIDVWIQSILMHLKHNNNDNINDIVQRIYREAINALSKKPELLSEFKEKYQLALAGEIQN